MEVHERPRRALDVPKVCPEPHRVAGPAGRDPRAAIHAVGLDDDAQHAQHGKYGDCWPGEQDCPRIVLEAGAQAIRAKSLAQTARLIALAETRGLSTATPRDPARRGGTAAVDFENAREVARELNARDVVVDYRPGVGIRLSPHFYTDDRELDLAFSAIDEIRETGSWRRWSDREWIVS